MTTADTVSAGTLFTVTEIVAEHPLPSTTVTLYVPDATFVVSAPVLPAGDHVYVYVPDPPDTNIYIAELLTPEQLVCVTESDSTSGRPSATTTLSLFWHPLASVAMI